MEKLKTAVIGLGMFGEIHAQTYFDLDTTELSIVCDIDEEKAKKFSDKYNCKYTNDFHEIAKSDVDIVSIATPDFAHYDPAVAMIKSGKHTLIEKPLTTDVSEAKEIINLAKKNNVYMMTDFQNRWNPPFVKAKEDIDNGNLGEPTMISARLSNKLSVPTKYITWSDKSGPEWFLFPHILDLVLWLTSQKPKKVFAVGKKSKLLNEYNIDAYDAVHAEIILDNCFANIETSWIIPNEMADDLPFSFEFLGDKGHFKAEPAYNGLEVTKENRTEVPFYSGWQHIHGYDEGFFKYPIKHFVDAVKNNEKLLVEPEDGLIITKTINAILESIETGKSIEL